jgi:hypothetical protein
VESLKKSLQRSKTSLGAGALIAVAVIIYALFYTIYEYRVLGETGFPLDDAWIHFVFARNLARGSGFSYNPGELIAGSTAPLWTVLLAGSDLLPGGAILWAKILGVFFLWTSGFLVYRIARVFKMEWGVAVLLGMITVSTSRLVWGSLSGMEITLFITLALLGLYLNSLTSEIGSLHNFLSTGSLALATLARPEGLVIFLVVRVMDFFTLGSYGDRPLLKRNGFLTLIHTGLYGLMLLPAILFNLSTSHTPLPNTFSALVGQSGLLIGLKNLDLLEIFRSTIIYPIKAIPSMLLFLGNDNMLFLLLFPILLWWLIGNFKKQGLQIDFSIKNRNLYTISILLLALPLSHTMVFPNQDLNHHMGRYLSVMSPLYVLVSGIGLAYVFADYSTKLEKFSKFHLRLVAVVGFVLVLLLGLFSKSYLMSIIQYFYELSPRLIPFEDRWPMVQVLFWTSGMSVLIIALVLGVISTQKRKIEYSRNSIKLTRLCLLGALLFGIGSTILNVKIFAGQVENIQEMQVQMGRWAASATPPDALLAVNDIGAITYFSERKILDVVGLVSPEVIPYLRQGERGILSLLAEKRPDYLIVFPNWYPRIANLRPLFTPVYSVTVEPNLICGGRTMVAYRANWEFWPEFAGEVSAWH